MRSSADKLRTSADKCGQVAVKCGQVADKCGQVRTSCGQVFYAGSLCGQVRPGLLCWISMRTGLALVNYHENGSK